MPDPNFILIPLAAAAFLGAVYFGFWILFRGLFEKGRMTRSLNMGLLSISLPREGEENPSTGSGQGSQNHKEAIGVMEQVFANLAHIKETGGDKFFYPKPYLVLEIAANQEEQEVGFYLSAPRRYLEIVKKIIYGFYPDAQIEEIKDYNMFNRDGQSLGSFLTLKRNHNLPLATYKNLQSDPLGEIVNALAKLKEGGEGGALQIVFSPAPSGWTGQAREILLEMERGKSFEAARSEAEKGFLSKVIASFRSSTKPNLSTPQEAAVVSLAGRKTTEAIQEKISRPGFACNVRLLTSASSREEAESALIQMESAFGQFESPELNGFRVNRLKGRALKNLIFEFAFRLFNKKTQIILNSEELSGLFHFSTAGAKSMRLKALKAKNAPAPSNLPKEGIVLGKNVYRGVETVVRLDKDDRRRHLYVIGQTGTGKSGFLHELVRQDIESGQGFAVVDPHGELVEDLLDLIPPERAEQVIYFNPGDLEHPLGLNMLEYDPSRPEQKTFIVNEMINIFDKLYDMRQTGGPMFEQYMRNALLLLMDDPEEKATLMDVPKVFADAGFRAKLLVKVKNEVVGNFWRDEAEKAGGEAALQNITPYVTSKFSNFIANDYMRPIISQPRSAFDFRQLMDEGKILLVNLAKGKLGALNSNLLGMILVGKITMAAFSRADIEGEKRRDFFLYIDEFQNFTTESISVILSEARKYRLNLIVAHQYIKQLEEKNRDAVFGNVGSICAFRVGAEDAEAIKKQFEPVFSAHDLMNLDNFNAYVKILINGATSAPFNIATYPPKKGNRARGLAIQELSKAKYGKS